MDNNKAIELEWENTLQVLAEKNASLMEFSYFLNLARMYYGQYGKIGSKPRVIMLGHYFPEEIIRAMGIDFCYVCGGSYESTLLPDVNIPKDADDEIRSLIGVLRSEPLNPKDDVVLLPLYSDSMKKLKALLGDIATVLCFEVPSDKKDLLLQKRFENEIKRVTAELKRHFKKKLSAAKLKEQCLVSKKAAEVFTELEKLHKEKATALSASALLFIASSYNMCNDKAEWISHLESLITELRNNTISTNAFPEVMLLGSPIYVPNYKVLFAVEEMKLRIHTIIHPDIEHIKVLHNAEKSFSLKNLANQYFESDISPIYIKNPTTENKVMNAVNTGKIKGIIAHIIKGQTLFDFEFKRIEQFTADSKIPMNRIETVYNNSDVEQIKLRLEAFAEMLNMKHAKTSK